jgi:hypothetical protein
MSRIPADVGLLQKLYSYEEALSGLLASLGIQFSPINISGEITNAGFYNLSGLTPVTTEAVTYAAAGTAVSDTLHGHRPPDPARCRRRRRRDSGKERHPEQIRRRHGCGRIQGGLFTRRDRSEIWRPAGAGGLLGHCRAARPARQRRLARMVVPGQAILARHGLIPVALPAARTEAQP